MSSKSTASMTSEQTQIYRSKLERVILNTSDTLELWKNYERDYKSLKVTLEELDHETEHKVMVRILKYLEKKNPPLNMKIKFIYERLRNFSLRSRSVN